MNITMAQAVKFCDTYPKLKSMGIKLNGLGMVDLAMNYSSLLPVYNKFVAVAKMSSTIKDFQRKFNEIRVANQVKIVDGQIPESGNMIADGAKYMLEVKALEAEYGAEIKAHNERMAKSEQMMEDESSTYLVNIVPIDKGLVVVDDTKPGFEEALATITFMLK